MRCGGEVTYKLSVCFVSILNAIKVHSSTQFAQTITCPSHGKKRCALLFGSTYMDGLQRAFVPVEAAFYIVYQHKSAQGVHTKKSADICGALQTAQYCPHNPHKHAYRGFTAFVAQKEGIPSAIASGSLLKSSYAAVITNPALS